MRDRSEIEMQCYVSIGLKLNHVFLMWLFGHCHVQKCPVWGRGGMCMYALYDVCMCVYVYCIRVYCMYVERDVAPW